MNESYDLSASEEALSDFEVQKSRF